MKRHTNHVQKYVGSLEQLADDVENMSYDAVTEFLEHLAGALYNRAQRDRSGNKRELAERLTRASFNIDSAAIETKEAWNICAPYMKDNDDVR